MQQVIMSNCNACTAVTEAAPPKLAGFSASNSKQDQKGPKFQALKVLKAVTIEG